MTRQAADAVPTIDMTRAEIIEHRYLDEVTGAFSRRACLGLLSAAVHRARNTGRPLLVAVSDVDRFGRINDLYGIAVGDGVLRAAAGTLIDDISAEATVARLGNDEFMFVSEAATGEAAAHMAVDLVSALGKSREIDGHELHLTASIGFTVAPEDGAEAEALLAHARTALETAKRRGGRQAVRFSRSLHGEERFRTGLEQDLARALRREELFLQYQPMVSADDRALIGCEALVRWQHPGRGMVQPDSFLSAAASGGLLGELGEQVLRHACAQAASWRAAGLSVPPVSVNVDPVQLLDPEFSALLMATVAEHGLSSADIALELTERGILDDIEAAYRRAATLCDAGFSLALDDFGTGQSSLALLHRFPFRTVKIDRGFVAAMGREPKADGIVRAICVLGRELGMSVVAEGVEEPWQAERLKGYGCTHFQGWLFGRAVGADDFASTWLAQRAA